MRVGIATLHYGYNEGAILQAYCLAQAIEAMGHSASIIDYRYSKKNEIYQPADSPRKLALKQAIDEWLPRTAETYWDDGLKSVESEACSSFETVVVGSDVVWELKYRYRLRSIFPGGILPKQTLDFYPAFPNVYWLTQTNCRKVSYAASIGSFEWRRAPKRDLRSMGAALDSFDAVSVRDERTFEFAKAVRRPGSSEPTFVPDPTLLVAPDLFDDQADACREFLEQAGVKVGGKVLGVVSADQEQVKQVSQRYRELGWQVVGLGTKNSFCDVHLADHELPPQFWAVAFRYFDLTISERMHGCIFAIKNASPVVAIDPYENKTDDDSKIKSLLSRFGMDEYRISRKGLEADALFDLTCKRRESDFQKEHVAERQAELRQQGREFLAGSLA